MLDPKAKSPYLRDQKEDNVITVPILPQARRILDKYTHEDGVVELPTISNSNFNLYLKELAKLAGFDTPITISKQKGSRRITSTHPKYELIGTHTARKTFITLSFEFGMDPEVVRRITGHKSPKVFIKYLKITDKKKGERLLKAWGGEQ